MSGLQEKPVEPPACAFDNWDEFYPVALQYHLATRPEHDRLCDRIETLKQFMPEDVTYYLGGFVRTHPRFCTLEGWDQWVADVAEMFSLHKTIYNGRRNCDRPPNWAVKLETFFKKPGMPTLPTVENLTIRYQKRMLALRGLWTGLDKLVSDGTLTSVEQRQLFWNALPESERTRLVELCCLFDPQDELWEKVESDSARLGEQKLSQLMEYSIVDGALTNFSFSIWLDVISAIAQTPGCLYFITNGSTLSTYGVCLFALYMVVLSFLLASAYRTNQRMKQLKARRSVLLSKAA